MQTSTNLAYFLKIEKKKSFFQSFEKNMSRDKKIKEPKQKKSAIFDFETK